MYQRLSVTGMWLLLFSAASGAFAADLYQPLAPIVYQQSGTPDVVLCGLNQPAGMQGMTFVSDGVPMLADQYQPVSRQHSFAALSESCSSCGQAGCEGCRGVCGDPACDPYASGLFGGVGDPTRTSVWVWVAPTYVSSVFDTQFGVGEGAVIGYRLSEAIGLYAGIGFNHHEQSTQVLGTLGLQKFGNPEGVGLLERTTVWMFWDQGADTEGGDGASAHQLRFNVGWVSSNEMEVGMTFSFAIEEPTRHMLTPLGGQFNMSAGNSIVGPYVRMPVGVFDVTGILGFSEATDSAVVGLGAEAPLTDTSNLFIEAKSGGDDVYSLSLGYKVGFGRADTTRYR